MGASSDPTGWLERRQKQEDDDLAAARARNMPWFVYTGLAIMFLIAFTFLVQTFAPSAITDCLGPGNPCFPSQ